LVKGLDRREQAYRANIAKANEARERNRTLMKPLYPHHQTPPTLTFQQRFFCEKLLQLRLAAKPNAVGLTKAAALAAGYSESVASKKAMSWIRETREDSKCPQMWEFYEVLKRDVGKKLLANMVTIDMIVEELACIAFLDPKDLFDDNGNLLPMKSMPENTRRAIAAIDIMALQGRGSKADIQMLLKKIKLWDKLGALEALLKHKGGLPDGDADPGLPGGRAVCEGLDFEKIRRGRRDVLSAKEEKEEGNLG
jgi:phage terminase small subunit